MSFNLEVSKISACKEILETILEEKGYTSLKECFYDLYGSTLFRAIPVGIRNSILYDHFILQHKVGERSIRELYSEVNDTTKDLVHENSSLEDVYSYYKVLNDSLTEEKVSLNYFFRLREACEERVIPYEKSLLLISEIEREFLQSSRDIYDYFIHHLDI